MVMFVFIVSHQIISFISNTFGESKDLFNILVKCRSNTKCINDVREKFKHSSLKYWRGYFNPL